MPSGSTSGNLGTVDAMPTRAAGGDDNGSAVNETQLTPWGSCHGMKHNSSLERRTLSRSFDSAGNLDTVWGWQWTMKVIGGVASGTDKESPNDPQRERR